MADTAFATLVRPPARSLRGANEAVELGQQVAGVTKYSLNNVVRMERRDVNISADDPAQLRNPLNRARVARSNQHANSQRLGALIVPADFGESTGQQRLAVSRNLESSPIKLTQSSLISQHFKSLEAALTNTKGGLGLQLVSSQAMETTMDVTALSFKRAGACSGGNCVEVAVLADHVLIRDSKNPDVAPLSFTHDEWAAFVKGVENGEFRFQ
jgi:hypothetical protein